VPGCRAHAQERVKIEIGSQDDPELLDRLCADGAPSIVIDDGSHTTAHRIATFEYLFPRLAPGGIYVIEDFSQHVGSEAADAEIASQQNSPEYFLDVGRRCFANGNVKTVQKVPMEVAKLVDSTMFFANAVAMRKKHTARDVPRALAMADAYLPGRRLGAQAHENLATYILRFDGPMERAEQEVQKAIDKDGISMSRLALRAELLLAQKNRKAAKQEIAEAAAQPPTTLRVLLQLAKLQEKTGDIEGAIKSAEAAIAMEPHAGPPKRALKNLLAKRKA
jgi:tetratricopeptide (TPR) repeat protein